MCVCVFVCVCVCVLCVVSLNIVVHKYNTTVVGRVFSPSPATKLYLQLEAQIVVVPAHAACMPYPQ